MALRTKQRLELRIFITSVSVVALLLLQYYLSQNGFFQDSANYPAKDKSLTADQLIFFAFVAGLIVADVIYIFRYFEYINRARMAGHKLTNSRRKKNGDLHVE